MRDDILNNKELILKMIKNNESKAEMCKIFSCKPDTLNRALKKMGLEYKGNQSRKGLTRIESRASSTDYLGTGKRIQSHKLKLMLLRDGIFIHQCSMCKNTEWNDKPIPLELDHIDGVHNNNELSNLRLLCPNCHAQTDTYRGKNIKKKKEILKYEPDYMENKIIISEPKIKIKDIIQECKLCKNEFTRTHLRTYCSYECSREASKIANVDVEKLRELVWLYPIKEVAKLLGVSDSSIHKRCKKYNIEKPSRGHWLKPENKSSK